MDFTKIFSRAWNLVWNNKFMFILGFLAALGSGGGGGANTNFSTSSGNLDLPPGMADNFEQFLSRFAPFLIILICFLFILGIVLWLVRLSAQGGLISAAVRLDAGEKVSFGEAFSAGIGKLGRLVGISLLLYGPFILVSILAAAVFFITLGSAVMFEVGRGSGFESVLAGLGVMGICFALLACILVPLWIIVTVIYPFAQRGAMLRDLGVMDSIRHGWDIVRTNLTDVILLGLFFVVIGFVFALVTGVIIVPVALITLGPAIFGMMRSGTVEVISIVLLVGGGICLGLIAAAINAILVAFRSTATTLAYQEFIAKTA